MYSQALKIEHKHTLIGFNLGLWDMYGSSSGYNLCVVDLSLGHDVWDGI